MKKTLIALIAACVGCCAAAFLFPAALAAGAVTGLTAWLGRFSLETVLCALPLAFIVFLGVAYLVMKVRTKKACASDGACGCK